MERRTREILDIIDEELATGSRAAKQLWDILSALRGPDDCIWELKEHLTVPIRSKAFPRTAKGSQSLMSKPNRTFVLDGKAQFMRVAPKDPPVIDSDAYSVGGIHFLSHANLAIERLWK